MLLTDMHSLAARTCITHDNSASKRSVPSAVANPADAGRIIEIILLFAIGVELTRESQIWESSSAGRWEWVLAFDAVKIAVKEAGVAIIAKEDESVCKRLEEGFNGSFESLVRWSASNTR